MKKCSKPGAFSLKSSFHKHSTSEDGLQSQCKSCRSQKQKRRSDDKLGEN